VICSQSDTNSIQTKRPSPKIDVVIQCQQEDPQTINLLFTVDVNYFRSLTLFHFSLIFQCSRLINITYFSHLQTFQRTFDKYLVLWNRTTYCACFIYSLFYIQSRTFLLANECRTKEIKEYINKMKILVYLQTLTDIWDLITQKGVSLLDPFDKFDSWNIW